VESAYLFPVIVHTPVREGGKRGRRGEWGPRHGSGEGKALPSFVSRRGGKKERKSTAAQTFKIPERSFSGTCLLSRRVPRGERKKGGGKKDQAIADLLGSIVMKEDSSQRAASSKSQINRSSSPEKRGEKGGRRRGKRNRSGPGFFVFPYIRPVCEPAQRKEERGKGKKGKKKREGDVAALSIS